MKFSLAFLITLSNLVAAQEGASTGATSSNPFTSYKCPDSCKLPNCRCANAPSPHPNPPHDDAVQTETQTQALALFANRKNPNGCSARATFFAQTYFSDPLLVQQWAAAGNEVADHSMSHGGNVAGANLNSVSSFEEYEGNRAYMSTFAGINRGKIQGVRFPFLNYSADSLALLSKMGYLYDSSMAAVDQERVWPYTLDYGAATDCTGQLSLCGKPLNAPGLWEIPMMSIQGTDGKNHLMDPFNDPTITAPISAEVVTNSYKATFDLHYKTKIPFGVYLHPIWVGPGVPPAIPSGTSKFAAVSAFLDYAMAQPNVWMVTHQQLIAYMKNPVSAAELGSQPYMQCPAPPANICNGAGNSTLFETCNLPNGTMRTCFGCPATYPDIANPTPARTTSRCVVPDTCDGLYWDPVACSCLPGGSYKDSSRPIQSKAQFDSWLNTTATAGGNRGNSNGAAAVGCSLFAIFLACLLI